MIPADVRRSYPALFGDRDRRALSGQAGQYRVAGAMGIIFKGATQADISALSLEMNAKRLDRQRQALRIIGAQFPSTEAGSKQFGQIVHAVMALSA